MLYRILNGYALIGDRSDDEEVDRFGSKTGDGRDLLQPGAFYVSFPRSRLKATRYGENLLHKLGESTELVHTSLLQYRYHHLPSDRRDRRPPRNQIRQVLPDREHHRDFHLGDLLDPARDNERVDPLQTRPRTESLGQRGYGGGYYERK